jgi:Xaa-Pro aminopeptidase
MSISRNFRHLTAIVALFALTLALPVLSTTRASDSKSASSVIRVAPPAPVISDEARLAELSSRRARVAEKLGATAVLVLFSAEPRVYTNDVDYEYRQENNLYYLTNLKQKGATLVMMPGNQQTPEILFLPKRDPAAETWTGHMYSPEEARKISGIGEIWEANEFEPFMRALRLNQPYRPQGAAILLSGQAAAHAQTPQGSAVGNPSTASASSGSEALFAAAAQGDAELFLLMPRETESREYKREQNFAAQWARTSSGYGVRDAWPIFTEMRLRKSPMELQFLQHAIDITGEALGRSMAVAGRVNWEYEVEAEVEYTFKRRNADFWGYPSIVGCGPNATTLHYDISQGSIKPGDLLLMDVGAEYGHFSADVTRTFPVNGKFTREQAEIYNIVYAAQEAAARATHPGITLGDVHNASAEVIKDGLLKLGLITDRNSNQYRVWFMHGNSHFLGMNVHDVGTRATKLDVGMTFTNEPGIYIREDALEYLPKTPENEKFIAAVRPAFEKYKNIGVRIEDDMLVTADGVKWMTVAIPRSIADIEAFIARASRELKTSGLRLNPAQRGGNLSHHAH